jgi:hypothetical protein
VNSLQVKFVDLSHFFLTRKSLCRRERQDDRNDRDDSLILFSTATLNNNGFQDIGTTKMYN